MAVVGGDDVVRREVGVTSAGFGGGWPTKAADPVQPTYSGKRSSCLHTILYAEALLCLAYRHAIIFAPKVRVDDALVRWGSPESPSVVARAGGGDPR